MLLSINKEDFKTFFLSKLGMSIDTSHHVAAVHTLVEFAKLKIKLEIEENQYSISDLYENTDFITYLNQNFDYSSQFNSLFGFHGIKDSFIIKNSENIKNLFTEKGYYNELDVDSYFTDNVDKISYYYLVKGFFRKYQYDRQAKEDNPDIKTFFIKSNRVLNDWIYSRRSYSFRNTKQTRLIDGYNKVIGNLITQEDIDKSLDIIMNNLSLDSEQSLRVRELLEVTFKDTYKFNPR